MKRSRCMKNGTYVICCFVVLSLMGGCDFVTKCKLNGISYKDSAFLNVRGNVWREIYWKDSISKLAVERLYRHLYLKNGRYTWNMKRGADLKISENIYDYMVCEWTYRNRLAEIGVVDLNGYHADTASYNATVRMTMPPSDMINPPDRKNTEWIADGVAYRDSVFLRLEENPEWLDAGWKDSPRYAMAFKRFYRNHLFVENGHFKINIQSGAEIKISENIYEYLKHMYDVENGKLNSGDYELSKSEDGDYTVVEKDGGDKISK